jgi:hypothetical protein
MDRSLGKCVIYGTSSLWDFTRQKLKFDIKDDPKAHHILTRVPAVQQRRRGAVWHRYAGSPSPGRRER